MRQMTPEERILHNPITRLKQPLRLNWKDLRAKNTLLLFSATAPLGTYTIVESNSFSKGQPNLTRISARDFNTGRIYTSDWYSDEIMLEREIEHAKTVCQEHFVKLLMSCFE